MNVSVLPSFDTLTTESCRKRITNHTAQSREKPTPLPPENVEKQQKQQVSDIDVSTNIRARKVAKKEIINPALVEVVYLWAQQKEFVEICNLTWI